MIQSLLYQVPFFQIPPSRAFFPGQYRCVWRWTWPDAAGRNGGGQGPWAGAGVTASPGRSSPCLPSRSAPAKLRSLPSGSVTPLRSPWRPSLPCLWQPVGLPAICNWSDFQLWFFLPLPASGSSHLSCQPVYHLPSASLLDAYGNHDHMELIMPSGLGHL